MPATSFTYLSRGGLLLCKLSKAKMPEGAARLNELDYIISIQYMIYPFHKDIIARSDGIPLLEKLLCEVVHASCPIVLLLL